MISYYSNMIEKTPNKRTKIPPNMIALDNMPINNLNILKNLKQQYLASSVLKNIILFAILTIGIFSLGFTSIAEAHPHVTIDLMNTHSHDLYTTEDFLIHTFEHVVLFVEQIHNIIFQLFSQFLIFLYFFAQLPLVLPQLLQQEFYVVMH